MGSCSESPGCVGRQVHVSLGSRGQDQAETARGCWRAWNRRACRLRGSSPPALLATWPCPLRPGRALFQLAPTIVPSPVHTHTACALFENIPVPSTPPPPSPNVAHLPRARGVTGAGFPHPPVPHPVPRSRAFASGCLRLVSPLQTLGQHLRLPAGSWLMWLRPIPHRPSPEAQS